MAPSNSKPSGRSPRRPWVSAENRPRGGGQRSKSGQPTKHNAVKRRSTTAGSYTTRRRSVGATAEKKTRDALSSTSQPRQAKEHNTSNHSSYGALKHLGPAPSAEDIEQVRREVWSSFSSDEAA